ncbi:MAG: hypothetical protein Q8N14_03295 [Candidatus Omnitrophota bacterium]|nr:hypothetical protein [Candidatus Omnitrophota bacterium]
MKRTGLLTVGFIFLFVGIGFAAQDFAKFSTLKTDDKLLKGTSSIKSTATATMRVEKSTARPAIEAKGPALKSGGALAGYKVNAAPQARTAIQGVKRQSISAAAKGTGALQKTTPKINLPTNNAPVKKLTVPAAQKSASSLTMPKIGGTKIGGRIGQTGFGK